MTSALIVDDEPDLLLLLRMTIEAADDGLRVVGEATCGAEAVERHGALKPDVVVLDYRLPDMSGLEIAKRMLDERPEQAIILWSAYLDADTRQQASDLGIKACLGKNEIARLGDELRLTAAY